MTSFQVEEWLRKGIAAAKAGDAKRAYEFLVKVVDIDEYNEQAWLWLSSVVETDADREVCLDNVLAINPDNKLAKAGLVHLRRKLAQPPPPLEPDLGQPEPDASAAGAVLEESPQAEQIDWWDQPATAAPAAEPSGVEEQLPAATAADVSAMQTAARSAPRARWSFSLPTARSLAALALVALGLLTATGAGAAALRAGPFDPSRYDYASAVRPLLAEYEAWWQGPQGSLIEELNSLCGPESNGWRNRDVLQACSTYSGVDCGLLGAHCGADVERMRQRVSVFAREAQETGAELLAAFNTVTPPDEVTQAHARFLACLRARVAEAERVGRLARGEALSPPAAPPVCEMFSTAESQVQAYVGTR